MGHGKCILLKLMALHSPGGYVIKVTHACPRGGGGRGGVQVCLELFFNCYVAIGPPFQNTEDGPKLVVGKSIEVACNNKHRTSRRFIIRGRGTPCDARVLYHP